MKACFEVYNVMKIDIDIYTFPIRPTVLNECVIEIYLVGFAQDGVKIIGKSANGFDFVAREGNQFLNDGIVFSYKQN